MCELDTVIHKMPNKRLEYLDCDKQLINCQQSRAEFDPPYDSPIENDFAWNIIKYLDKETTFKKQVSVDTVCGRFRLDFFAHQLGRCIGFECDGKEFHDNEVSCSARDRWRDALILETGVVEVIYRFPGKDLVHNINDCLFILASYEPLLFSERGIEILKVLASDEIKQHLSQMQQRNNSELISCWYKESRYQYGLRIYRHHCKNSFLLEKASFAKKYGKGDLDHIMQQFDIERSPKW